MALPYIIAVKPTNDASTQHIILDVKIRTRVSVFALNLTDLMPLKSNWTKARVNVSSDLFNKIYKLSLEKGPG